MKQWCALNVSLYCYGYLNIIKLHGRVWYQATTKIDKAKDNLIYFHSKIHFYWCIKSHAFAQIFFLCLTHWGRVTHICVSKLTIIGSDNGLSPRRRQAIIWTNAGILSIGHLGTNFSEILIEILTFSFKKMHLKMSSGKWRPFCVGLNVLT